LRVSPGESDDETSSHDGISGCRCGSDRSGKSRRPTADGCDGDSDRQSGQLVGGVLAALVNGYNPSMVVVGGGVAQAGEVLLAAIRDAIYRRSRSLATQNVPVVRAEMGKTATLVGASLAVAEELFAWENLRQWIDRGAPTHEAGGTGEWRAPPGSNAGLPRRSPLVATPPSLPVGGSR